MFENMLKRWRTRLFLKKNSWLIIAITGVMLVIVIGLSVYGDNVGDLIVSVDAKTSRALSLSETGEFEAKDASSLLSAAGIKDIRDSTYFYIPEDITEGNGLKSDKKDNMYFAYSFYLKNMSTVSVGYTVTLKFDKCTQDIDKAVRIMILVDDNEPMIFARPKEDGSAEFLEDDENINKKGYTTTPIVGNECEILRQEVTEVNSVQKYTVVMWLEGWDSDCKDSIVGGKLAASLTFRIIDTEEATA
jgi:hypothetical protein